MKITGILLRHYKRHPVQALFLLTGVIVSNMLLVGTLLINAQARASYAQGEKYFGSAPIGQIRHQDQGKPLNEHEYIRLRRLGFDMLVPVLREFVRTVDGQVLELSGIDLFAIPQDGRALNTGAGQPDAGRDTIGFAFPPYQTWVAPARLRQLNREEGKTVPLGNGKYLPPLLAMEGQQLGHRLLMSLEALQSVSGRQGQLSSLLVFSGSSARLAELLEKLPAQWVFIAGENAPDAEELTRSFHLNLAAMGLLAFVVGIFLTYNAIAFSYTDRSDLVRKLMLSGVLKSELRVALLLELGIFLGLGMLIGTWLGAQVSAFLLPGVGQTLAQLYGVYISYPDALVPSGFWLPVAMTVIAALLCAIFPLREVLQTPLLERRLNRWQLAAVARRDTFLALTGVVFLALSLLATLLSTSHVWIALAGMACLLLGTALLLPLVLRLLIWLLRRLVPARMPRLSWLLADSRWLLGPASLAMMALTLAMVANSGLNTMITSFRVATSEWLDQRLVAQLYLRDQQDLSGLEQWLEEHWPAVKSAERYRENITRHGPGKASVGVEAISLRDDQRFHDGIRLIRGIPDAKARFERSDGIYISERAWRLDGWQLGDRVALCDSYPDAEILGIYHDYGNPRSQWLLSRQLFKSCWPDSVATGTSLFGPGDTDWPLLRQELSQVFGLPDDRVIDQDQLKQVGLAVFDRTFVVTNALNLLTLIVAAIGIFCAISAIHHHRVGQQALLASLGLTRLERGSLLLLQWGFLGLLSMALVWPFGTALAAYLGGIVTPAAFGWSFPLVIEWRHLVWLAVLASGALMLAVLLPSARLLSTTPAAVLREQNL
jgi:putative ABC transport system permease protein